MPRIKKLWWFLIANEIRALIMTAPAWAAWFHYVHQQLGG